MVVKQDFDGIVFEMSGILQLLHQMPEASYGDYRAVFHQFLVSVNEVLALLMAHMHENCRCLFAKSVGKSRQTIRKY